MGKCLTQPVKQDLMDFCFQTNIDQALTLSFTQMQQDIWSQPMTPTVLTPRNEQIELVPEEHQSTVTFQSVIPDQPVDISLQPIASTITIVPNTKRNVSVESSRSSAPSIRHLTTAIEDNDDELFSISRRKMSIAQWEKMTVNEFLLSTQVFVVSKSVNNSNIDDNQSLTQAFTTVSLPTSTMKVRLNRHRFHLLILLLINLIQW